MERSNRTKSRIRKPKVLSLFSGIGGLDLGFVQAGFSLVGAYDNWGTAVKVHQRNLAGDAQVVDLSTDEIEPRENPDVVVAGSPCQGFSTIGTRRVDDPRNWLFVRAAQLALKLEPQVIVLENVRGIIGGKHKKFYDQAVRTLENAGFSVHHLELSAQDAGLPQRRRRVFLIATRSCSSVKIESVRTNISVGQIISGSEGQRNHEPLVLDRWTNAYEIANVIGPGQKFCDVRGGTASVHSWQIPRVFGATTRREQVILRAIMRLRRRIRQRATGDADPVLRSDISDFLGFDVTNNVDTLIAKGYLKEFGVYVDLSRRFNGKYRRLQNNGISNAVDTRFGDPHYFLHPKEQRGLSAREAARIQGFPDSFVFSGTSAEQFRMIGNAVPVPMGRLVARAVKQVVH